MENYNKFMLKLWFVASIAIPIVVTYLVITEGFKKWGAYYVLAAFTIIIYLLRRYMMKRMEKHLQYLKQKEDSGNN
jgi:c-di-AMP phosphodiesterase-like protein